MRVRAKNFSMPMKDNEKQGYSGKRKSIVHRLTHNAHQICNSKQI